MSPSSPAANAPVTPAVSPASPTGSNPGKLSTPTQPHVNASPAASPTGPGKGPRDGPVLPPTSAYQIYIMDDYKGVVLTPNVDVNDFSTYNVQLDADVTAGSSTAPPYSWSTTSAPDATSVTGASSYRINFTWASFSTGAPRTDSVTITVGTGGSAVSQTITFLVASTSSLGYSATQPTSPSTFPALVPPDALTGAQSMAAAGPYASVGLTDGELQTSHAFPSYNPNVPALQLQYVSTAADPKEVFVAHYQLSPVGNRTQHLHRCADVQWLGNRQQYHQHK